MIKADRIAKLLAPNGFELAWETWLGRQFNFDFVRLSKWDGVFEHIDIDSSGKKGEAVVCRVFLSPLRGHQIRFKPTPEIDEFLFELADPKWGRRYTLIESEDDAVNWETRVADIAPPRVRDLAQQQGEEIARQTMAARASAHQYVKLIRDFSAEPVTEYLSVQLKTGRAPDASNHAYEFDGLMTSQGDLSDALECASFAISKFGMEVDPDHNGFQGESKSQNRELRLRLDIIADLLRNGAQRMFAGWYRVWKTTTIPFAHNNTAGSLPRLLTTMIPSDHVYEAMSYRMLDWSLIGQKVWHVRTAPTKPLHCLSFAAVRRRFIPLNHRQVPCYATQNQRFSSRQSILQDNSTNPHKAATTSGCI